MALVRFASGAVNCNYWEITANKVFYGGTLAMIHALGDLQKSTIGWNTLEGTSKAVYLNSDACDYNNFPGNVGESADGTNPFYHLNASCQGNIFLGGQCNTADNSNGTWIQFETAAHSNIVIGYYSLVGTAAFKQKVVDNSTNGNMLQSPWRLENGGGAGGFGLYLGEATSQKLGFFGTTPISRATLATGSSHTVDDVITALQNLALVKQS